MEVKEIANSLTAELPASEAERFCRELLIQQRQARLDFHAGLRDRAKKAGIAQQADKLLAHLQVRGHSGEQCESAMSEFAEFGEWIAPGGHRFANPDHVDPEPPDPAAGDGDVATEIEADTEADPAAESGGEDL